MKQNLYFASALFSVREKLLNDQLARQLESAGYGVFLPQRDGFEFSALNHLLADAVPGDAVESAMQTLIYLYDIAMLANRCDAVVAILDEPLDDGVLVEISYAKMLGKPVVGVRTDSRSPYGGLAERFGGIHFFAAFQCSQYLMASTACSDDLARLALAVGRAIGASPVSREARPLDPVTRRAAALLFDGVELGVDKVHDEVVMQRIVSNYIEGVKEFDAVAPRVWSWEGRAG